MSTENKKVVGARAYYGRPRVEIGSPLKRRKHRSAELLEIERLQNRIEKLLRTPKEHNREILRLREKMKSMGAARLAGAPTRNFSGEAIKAAAKFGGLKTAQLGKHVKKERAAAIKRAVVEFYGLK